MIWTLRNISLHLWITTLVVLPVCFYILTVLTRLFPGVNPYLVGIMLILVVFSVFSFLMDVTARKIITNLLKEGQSWERTGIMTKAGKRYVRALRVYDSFLLWPFSAKKTVKELCSVIARFQMNTGLENEIFNQVVFTYLKSNPEDRDIAQAWIRRLRQSELVTTEEQETLTSLAEAHISDPALSSEIAKICLGLGRTDYTARKLYARMQKEPGLEKTISSKIEELTESSEDLSLSQEIGYIHSEPVEPEKKKSGIRLMTIISGLISFVGMVYKGIISFVKQIISAVIKGCAYVQDNDRLRFVIKTGTLTVLGAWLVFFMFSTVSHMIKSKASPEEQQAVETQISMPFTIQVAAFNKKNLAERYVDLLSKKGLDARVSQLGSKGKIWYAVRISQFADKQSAAEYGRKLKSEKHIDDFFVSNR